VKCSLAAAGCVTHHTLFACSLDSADFWFAFPDRRPFTRNAGLCHSVCGKQTPRLKSATGTWDCIPGAVTRTASIFRLPSSHDSHYIHALNSAPGFASTRPGAMTMTAGSSPKGMSISASIGIAQNTHPRTSPDCRAVSARSVPGKDLRIQPNDEEAHREVAWDLRGPTGGSFRPLQTLPSRDDPGGGLGRRMRQCQ